MAAGDAHVFRNGVLLRSDEPVAMDTSEEPAPLDARGGPGGAVAAAVDAAGGRCIRLFIAGAVTHVGKTTICLSVLAALRKAGLQASELAYIKPATQCEAPDLLSWWCAAEGVEYVSGENAPLVFYQGFTRSFLAGEQGTSAQWLDKIAAKLDQMAQRRRVLIIDGVGFPAVGSIVGVDNADVAKAAKAPVLLVCKSGVGAAVDSFSLNSAYFLGKGVPVLGAVFNMGDLDGFNSWDKCAEAIGRWFTNMPGRRERFYGVVPMAQGGLDGLRERMDSTSDAQLRDLAALNASHFASHADLAGILGDAALDPWCRDGAPPPKRPRRPPPGPAGPPLTAEPAAPAAAALAPKSRAEVAAEAKSQGAKRGGG